MKHIAWPEALSPEIEKHMGERMVASGLPKEPLAPKEAHVEIDPETGALTEEGIFAIHEEAHAGNDAKLIEWYLSEESGIPWGQAGDRQACVDLAEQYMDADQAAGFCELRLAEAAGK